MVGQADVEVFSYLLKLDKEIGLDYYMAYYGLIYVQ